MRALLQRVSRASVRIDEVDVASIGPGLVVFLGIGHGDTATTADAVARRIAHMRVFADDAGRTNRSIIDVAGEAIVVSQFTLYADTSRGRRPGFTDAAPAELADRLYSRVAAQLVELGVARVATGQFGAEMAVELVNSGPFTVWLDSDQMRVPGT